MIDLALIVLFGVSLVFYFWAWLRIVHKAFARHWGWGLAVLLLNQPFNLAAISYLYVEHLKHQTRYIVSLFAPYAATLLVLWRIVDWD